jgi:FlaA1/EpsC-like NDP-sugar epimerase
MSIKKNINYLSRSILEIPRYAKRVIVIIFDSVMCVVAIWAALYLRLDQFFPLNEINSLVIYISIIIAIPIFWLSGLYKAIIRYSDKSLVAPVSFALLIYGLMYMSIVTVYTIPGVPRSIGIIQPLILFFLVFGSRMLVHFLYDRLYQINNRVSILPKALVYGAGIAGRQLVSALDNNLEMKIVGFIDDDYLLHNQSIQGKEIYSSKNLKFIIKTKKITHILLAIPSINRSKRMNILKELNKLKVIVRTLPSVKDLVSGKVTVSDIRELEIEDLLAREEVLPNKELLNKNINLKTVLVTGAGGSIGSELCRQIIKLNPKRLILVEISEYALYQIHQDLLQLNKKLNTEPGIPITPLLASIQDKNKIKKIFNTFKPDTVYHAAAYKHVPLVEGNICEGIRNNVFGTKFVADAALQEKVSDFVLISSDKAVRPTNVMGASKRLAELYLQSLTDKFKDKITKFCIVRFGNVLESSGSVIPKFKKQIKNGGPITLTDENVTRYFMTIPEASQLVIQAGAMSAGCDVFILDMGKPIIIKDLIKRMVNLSGLTVKDKHNLDGDIEVKITGLRPGEKLYEELFLGINPLFTNHPKIQRAQDPFISWSNLEPDLLHLNELIDQEKVAEILNLLEKLVQGYSWNGKLVDEINGEDILV